ncbi:hypothetical protein AB0G15_19370 [Streptosporangium sp. NPDC023825]|uniref:hypothetical protein n=1 Tax=Streptosporangium sp. NPDC023825 TaxID=3154909 RepID=UPI00342AE942
MRFPSRLLGAPLVYTALLWAGFYVLIVLITVGVTMFGTLDISVWEAATQLPRWLVLFIGVSLMREFLPLYIAHGQTRRQFGAQAAVTVTLYAPAFSALITLGYLLEALLYNLLDRPQTLMNTHLFSSPTQVPLIFAEYLVQGLAWVVAGALMGAAFYRWQAGGLLSLPFGVALVVLGESAIGGNLRLPFFTSALGFDLTPSVTTALGAGLACLLLGLAMTWPLIRDVPLRNRVA